VDELIASKVVPLERMVLETDGPFLAPVPHRGKTCHSGYIPFIAQFISDVINQPLQKVYAITTKNAVDVYGIQLTEETRFKE